MADVLDFFLAYSVGAPGGLDNSADKIRDVNINDTIVNLVEINFVGGSPIEYDQYIYLYVRVIELLDHEIPEGYRVGRTNKKDLEAEKSQIVFEEPLDYRLREQSAEVPV